MEWLTEKESEQDDGAERLVDVLPSKAVQVSEGTDVLDINDGDTVQAKFKGKLCPVKIVGKGMSCLCVRVMCVLFYCYTHACVSEIPSVQFCTDRCFILLKICQGDGVQANNLDYEPKALLYRSTGLLNRCVYCTGTGTAI